MHTIFLVRAGFDLLSAGMQTPYDTSEEYDTDAVCQMCGLMPIMVMDLNNYNYYFFHEWELL